MAQLKQDVHLITLQQNEDVELLYYKHIEGQDDEMNVFEVEKKASCKCSSIWMKINDCENIDDNRIAVNVSVFVKGFSSIEYTIDDNMVHKCKTCDEVMDMLHMEDKRQCGCGKYFHTGCVSPSTKAYFGATTTGCAMYTDKHKLRKRPRIQISGEIVECDAD